MNISDCYQVVRRCWLLFPTKDTLLYALTEVARPHITVMDKESAPDRAAFWSGCLDCEVSFIVPGSCFFITEIDDVLVKAVGSQVGWLAMNMGVGWVNESFERINVND